MDHRIDGALPPLVSTMGDMFWDVIPSIDCVDEHLQESFDFYCVRVPGVGRRVPWIPSSLLSRLE